jgi:hypothetical protein
MEPEFEQLQAEHEPLITTTTTTTTRSSSGKSSSKAAASAPGGSTGSGSSSKKKKEENGAVDLAVGVGAAAASSSSSGKRHEQQQQQQRLSLGRNLLSGDFGELVASAILQVGIVALIVLDQAFSINEIQSINIKSWISIIRIIFVQRYSRDAEKADRTRVHGIVSLVIIFNHFHLFNLNQSIGIIQLKSWVSIMKLSHPSSVPKTRDFSCTVLRQGHNTT